MIYGYARVSTHDQTPRLQLDALNAAGCNEIHQETGSGAKRDRPVLASLLARLQAGDVLVSWKLDRVGRSARHTLETIEALRARGVVYRSLTEGLDTSTPIGRFGLTVLAAAAEMERDQLMERITAGIAARRRAGGAHGRPPELTSERLAHARQLIAGGASIRQAARLTGIARSTLSDTLRRTLAPARVPAIAPPETA